MRTKTDRINQEKAANRQKSPKPKLVWETVGMRIVYWCDRIGNSAAELGQLALAPCGGHAVVTGGTAHGVVGNAAAIILPPSPRAVKKKPPRP